jgi:hypothetical protein
MSRKALLIPVLLLVAAAVGGTLYLGSRPDPSVRLVLRVHPFVGEEALQLEHGRYANPGGAGVFEVRDFQFFVSNIRLVAEKAVFREPESYHLARFDSDDGTHVIVIENVPREEYLQIELGIGVDPAANGSIESVGDLDPNGRMAWAWEVGYKFVLLEGGLALEDRRIPLVYHVGFDENYVQVSIPLAAARFERQEVTIDLRADLLQMFEGAPPVDMSTLSNVKFDRGDARRLAENFAHLVSLCPASCAD